MKENQPEQTSPNASLILAPRGLNNGVHLNLALRHGRLGSQFVYELLLDLDVPETVAHVGLIDVEQLRHGYNSKLAGFGTGVAGLNGHLAGGGETPPPPVCAHAGAALVNT